MCGFSSLTGFSMKKPRERPWTFSYQNEDGRGCPTMLALSSVCWLCPNIKSTLNILECNMDVFQGKQVYLCQCHIPAHFHIHTTCHFIELKTWHPFLGLLTLLSAEHIWDIHMLYFTVSPSVVRPSHSTSLLGHRQPNVKVAWDKCPTNQGIYQFYLQSYFGPIQCTVVIGVR